MSRKNNKKNDYDLVITKSNVITEERVKEIFDKPIKKGQKLLWGHKKKINKP